MDKLVCPCVITQAERLLLGVQGADLSTPFGFWVQPVRLQPKQPESDQRVGSVALFLQVGFYARQL